MMNASGPTRSKPVREIDPKRTTAADIKGKNGAMMSATPEPISARVAPVPLGALPAQRDLGAYWLQLVVGHRLALRVLELAP